MTSDPPDHSLTHPEQWLDEFRHLASTTQRFAELLEDAERRANVVGHLRQELQQVRAALSAAQIQAAEAAGRFAAIRNRLTEAERQATEYELERKEYRRLLQRVSGSRTLRSATRLAHLARLRLGKGRPVWHDMSRIDAYVHQIVDRALRSDAQPRGEESVPVWQIPMVPTTSDTDSVRVGIASIPIRVEGLLRVVDDLYDQADEIYVYLNNYPEPPSQLAGDQRIKVFTGPDLGDRGKFCFAEGFRGYYVSVDDDIAYPPFYVEYLIDGIERYDRKAIVGLHGSIIYDDFVNYYSTASRKVYSLNHNLWRDQFVHVLGTGCSAFHGETISLSLADFPLTNMADVLLAQKAQREAIPCVVLAHRGNWAPALKVGDGLSIYGASRAGNGSTQDVGEQTSRQVAALVPWKTHRAKPALVRPALRVALVGVRNSVCRSAFMLDMIAPYRADVRDFRDGEEKSPTDLEEFKPDVVVICLRDLTAESADLLVRRCARTGAQIVLELFGNRPASLSQAEVDQVVLWRNEFGDQVRIIDEAAQAARSATISEVVVSLPRPYRIRTRWQARFHKADGVVLGDLESLQEGELALGSLERWISVIREALPDVPIYAFGESTPSDERTFGVEHIEYKGGDRQAVLSQRRLMVSPLAFLPDALPIEATAAGVPVFCGSDSRVGECLGSAVIGVGSLSELAALLPAYYRDPLLWRSQSVAAISRARLLDFRVLGAQYYLALADLVEK